MIYKREKRPVSLYVVVRFALRPNISVYRPSSIQNPAKVFDDDEKL